MLEEAKIPTTTEILTFLQQWRTRDEIRTKFDLSNTQSYHYIRWLEKSNLIEMRRMRLPCHTNVACCYKAYSFALKNDN